MWPKVAKKILIWSADQENCPPLIYGFFQRVFTHRGCPYMTSQHSDTIWHPYPSLYVFYYSHQKIYDPLPSLAMMSFMYNPKSRNFICIFVENMAYGSKKLNNVFVYFKLHYLAQSILDTLNTKYLKELLREVFLKPNNLINHFHFFCQNNNVIWIFPRNLGFTSAHAVTVRHRGIFPACAVY